MTDLFSEPVKKQAKKVKYSEDIFTDLEIACCRHFRYLKHNTPHNPDDPKDDEPFVELDYLWKSTEDTADLMRRMKRDVNLLAHIWDKTKDFIKRLNTHVATIEEMVEFKIYFTDFYHNYICRDDSPSQVA